MTTYAQFLENGNLSAAAEMGCDMFTHMSEGKLSPLRHRQMLHKSKGTKTWPVLKVFGPLYSARKKPKNIKNKG
jgi:hypothetical protein